MEKGNEITLQAKHVCTDQIKRKLLLSLPPPQARARVATIADSACSFYNPDLGLPPASTKPASSILPLQGHER